jgi:hypothetical protein
MEPLPQEGSRCTANLRGVVLEGVTLAIPEPLATGRLDKPQDAVRLRVAVESMSCPVIVSKHLSRDGESRSL